MPGAMRHMLFRPFTSSCARPPATSSSDSYARPARQSTAVNLYVAQHLLAHLSCTPFEFGDPTDVMPDVALHISSCMTPHAYTIRTCIAVDVQQQEWRQHLQSRVHCRDAVRLLAHLHRSTASLQCDTSSTDAWTCTFSKASFISGGKAWLARLPICWPSVTASAAVQSGRCTNTLSVCP